MTKFLISDFLQFINANQILRTVHQPWLEAEGCSVSLEALWSRRESVISLRVLLKSRLPLNLWRLAKNEFLSWPRVPSRADERPKTSAKCLRQTPRGVLRRRPEIANSRCRKSRQPHQKTDPPSYLPIRLVPESKKTST